MSNSIADNIDLERVVWFLSVIGGSVSTAPIMPPAISDAILQEDSFFITQEVDGTSLILQEA